MAPDGSAQLSEDQLGALDFADCCPAACQMRTLVHQGCGANAAFPADSLETEEQLALRVKAHSGSDRLSAPNKRPCESLTAGGNSRGLRFRATRVVRIDAYENEFQLVESCQYRLRFLSLRLFPAQIHPRN